MKPFFSLFVIVVFCAFTSAAQDTLNWTPYYGGMELKDGIYLDFNSFRYNNPSVPLERLRDDQGLAIRDIRTVVSKLFWQPDTGARQAIRMHQLWGFCQNNAVYIQAGNGFYRIGLMGSLSHMIYEETYRDWDPYLYPGGSVRRTYVVQQMLDMRTGKTHRFNAAGMDEALHHDKVLLEEFRALPKKKRNSDEALFRFLRLYNDRHLLEFPL